MRRKGKQRTGTERGGMDELIGQIGGTGGYGGKRYTSTTKLTKAEKKKRDRPIEKKVKGWNPDKPKRTVSERIAGRSDILKLRKDANKRMSEERKAASTPKKKATKKKTTKAKVTRKTKVLAGSAAGLTAAAASQWIIHKDQEIDMPGYHVPKRKGKKKK